MNKRSVKKKRPVKASRSTAVRKSPARAAAPRKLAPRQPAKKSQRIAAKIPDSVKLSEGERITAAEVKAVSVAEVTALRPSLRAHKFQVGQTVSYTSSPITRPGASGSYKVVKLLPSDGDDYQYRIKNPGEAFERVAKESQLEIER
jgi:hypothetical protein